MGTSTRKVSKHFSLPLEVVEDFEDDVPKGEQSDRVEELLRGEGYGE